MARVKITTLLTRGVVEVVGRDQLVKRLKSGDKLRVKLGIDPTAPKLHLGHAVVLGKLRQFQDAGHTAVLIIGDWTARVGDPSGLKQTRQVLSQDQIRQNLKRYKAQVFKILRPDRVEVHLQSEWLGKKFKLDSLIDLALKLSANELLSHETFRQRLARGQRLAVGELFYPIVQGYDSFAVKADLELGAIEQKFNLLFGRAVQKALGQVEQAIMTLPYLVGTDGRRKMSKSFDNSINLNDPPDQMYGQIMSLPDSQIVPYFELVSLATDSALALVKKEAAVDSKSAKSSLAYNIVAQFYDQTQATQAQERFERLFRHKKIPSDLPVCRLTTGRVIASSLMVECGLATSRSQARRLIEQGGVRLDGKRLGPADSKVALEPGSVVQVGKRRFVKIILV